MALVTLKINDRSYEMTCDDGQEEHLHKLAEHVDERMRELAGSVGQVGEARLLIMASLLLADELYDAYRQIHALDSAAAELLTDESGADESGANGEMAPEIAAAALTRCAERIEAMAARLGGAGARTRPN